MTEKEIIKLVNNTQRTFNRIKPGGVIDTTDVEYYLENWFIYFDKSLNQDTIVEEINEPTSTLEDIDPNSDSAQDEDPAQTESDTETVPEIEDLWDSDKATKPAKKAKK